MVKEKMWTIPDDKVINNGYAYVRIPNHPSATSTGYVYEHRVVAENTMGRILTEYEDVHHMNGNKLDNRPENLVVLTRSQHAKLHSLEHGPVMGIFKCPECGRIFTRETRQSHLVKPTKFNATFCSNRCRGKFSSAVQHHGMTEDRSRMIETCLLSKTQSVPKK